MNGQYLLYGSYASYYTAKTRSYLRKKGIPFAERLPSDPQFREKVRPGSGSARIPQLLTPDNIVLQDSVTILDFLELRFPELPAIPTTACQRVFVHLMELLASEGLLRQMTSRAARVRCALRAFQATLVRGQAPPFVTAAIPARTAIATAAPCAQRASQAGLTASGARATRTRAAPAAQAA